MRKSTRARDTRAQRVTHIFGTLVKKTAVQACHLLLSYLKQPVQRLPDHRPAHRAVRQREAAVFVPRQAPAEAPQLPGQHQQQERRQHRGESCRQSRQHAELVQRDHLLSRGPLPSIHLCLCVKRRVSCWRLGTFPLSSCPCENRRK